MSRERGCDASSNFMLFNSADESPVPSCWPDTDTHCHRWKLREGFVRWRNRKNSLTARCRIRRGNGSGQRSHCLSVDGAEAKGGV